MQFQALVEKKNANEDESASYTHTKTYLRFYFSNVPQMVWQRSIFKKRLEQVGTDVNSKLGLSDLPNKNTGYPVKFEFQLDNKYFF